MDRYSSKLTSIIIVTYFHLEYLVQPCNLVEASVKFCPQESAM